MLIRLVLFLVVAGFGGLFAYRFLRSKSLSRSGGLDVFEIERLMKLAEGSQRLKGAMMLRVNIVEAAPSADKKSVSTKVDGALRRLAQVEVLRQRVRKTLGASDQDKIRGQLAQAETEAQNLDPERAEGKQRLAQQLQTQLEQLKQLHLREDELDESGHRLMVEMNNLHLALLNASSSEASAETGTVASALNQLEETSEAFRQKTSADEEVERLLKDAARGAIAAGSRQAAG